MNAPFGPMNWKGSPAGGPVGISGLAPGTGMPFRTSTPAPVGRSIGDEDMTGM